MCQFLNSTKEKLGHFTNRNYILSVLRFPKTNYLKSAEQNLVEPSPSATGGIAPVPPSVIHEAYKTFLSYLPSHRYQKIAIEESGPKNLGIISSLICADFSKGQGSIKS